MNNFYDIAVRSRPQVEMISKSFREIHTPTSLIMLEKLETLTSRYDPITLAEMENVALLNRVDIKFMLTDRQLLSSLAALSGDYWMLEINGLRQNQYKTLYFDTPDFSLFQAHVNNRPERFKVRSREYTDTQLSFFEVKRRTRKDRTIKDRIRTSRPVLAMDAEVNRWLQDVSPLDGAALEPKLWNTFTRMTLVGKHSAERVTLDMDLTFSSNKPPLTLEGVAIAEVKRDSAEASSPFLELMRNRGIRRRGFSKYAIGVGLMYDNVKKNALKPKLLLVEKMVKGY